MRVPELFGAGGWIGAPPELTLAWGRLTVGGDVGGGVLHVSAQAAACDAEAEHPVCRVVRQEWGVPVTVDPHGDSHLTLVLAGPA